MALKEFLNDCYMHVPQFEAALCRQHCEEETDQPTKQPTAVTPPPQPKGHDYQPPKGWTPSI